MPADVSEQVLAERRHPTYAACFRCIGPDCEDSCCTEWDIPVDRVTYERYGFFPLEKLGREVAQFVAVESGPQPDALFARLNRASSGACPFLGEDRLCRIQASYGQQLLPTSCSMFPRFLALVDHQLEGSLSLSCPEAARNVLLDPEFLDRDGNLSSGEFRTDSIFLPAVHKLADGSEADLIGIRRQLVSAVRDRSRPLRYRLLCIGSFCQELDAACSPSDVQSALERLARRISAMDEECYGRTDTPLKLKTVFDLSEARINEGCGARFEEAFLWFVQGANNVRDFEFANREFYAPYFEQHPYIFENYLLNYMFQNLFPFGRIGSADFIRQNAWGEYLQIAIQYAWLQALLVGTAGFFKRAFTSEHVIQVIQSFARATEHYPHVLASFGTYLRVRDLDSLKGMAALL
ncbi:MAG TPA: flagellin lysine-N-methylase [Edaphobacter sp.]|nr:flagellin lysine-N-methylase [Edaphobacter sp.]